MDVHKINRGGVDMQNGRLLRPSIGVLAIVVSTTALHPLVINSPGVGIMKIWGFCIISVLWVLGHIGPLLRTASLLYGTIRMFPTHPVSSG